jgi:hypothetical protein
MNLVLDLHLRALDRIVELAGVGLFVANEQRGRP